MNSLVVSGGESGGNPGAAWPGRLDVSGMSPSRIHVRLNRPAPAADRGHFGVLMYS